MSVKGFDINGIIEQYDFEALENAPVARGTGTNSAVIVNEVNPNTASGDYSFAAGYETDASGVGSFSIGSKSIASGSGSFAGGSQSAQRDFPTTASGAQSFAFGLSTIATGSRSVAFGNVTEASGSAAFSAGNYTVASGGISTAFGQRTEASASMSSAFGNYTQATGRAAMAIGQYNIADTNAEDSSHGTGARKYLFTIGNGTADDARSNAMTVDWDGNVEIGGKLTVGTAPSASMDVATKQFAESVCGLTTISENSSATGWRLDEDTGLCHTDSDYKLVKFAVTAGTFVKITCNDRFQFQNNISVPASQPSNRVGSTYSSGTYWLPVPTGATYLICSCLITGGVALAYTVANAKNGPDVYWLTMSSTNADVEAAYQADKICLLLYDTHIYTLERRVSATDHYFVAATPSHIYQLRLNNGTWAATSKMIPDPATEVTVSDTGAVSQALDAGKLYHFTGSLTSLTITLNAAASGQIAQYNFDFNCGSTAPTVTIPNTVTMPSGNTFAANTHYEVDIMNNYGVVASWPTS